MKFSVLLPTRNRLDLLKQAIETVRRQDYADWEIIVSDNCSQDDVGGYVTSLDEPRIKFRRSESFVPVTENWNFALEESIGDYVIMLGDDDGLLQGFFSRMASVIDSHGSPDMIYLGAYLYAYPGALPDAPEGFLQDYRIASFFDGITSPTWLSHESAVRLVRRSMSFEMPFTYNMQHSLISRRLITEMRRDAGPFFQSPYPDFYATNAAFLIAKSILIVPTQAVVVGISPKSFGTLFLSGRERDGVRMLGNDLVQDRNLAKVILPGTQDRTSWLLAMEAIRVNFGARFGLSVNYDRYRRLQIAHVLGADPRRRSFTKDEITELWDRLTPIEKYGYATAVRLTARILTILPTSLSARVRSVLRTAINRSPRIEPTKASGYESVLDVFAHVTVDSPSGSSARG